MSRDEDEGNLYTSVNACTSDEIEAEGKNTESYAGESLEESKCEPEPTQKGVAISHSSLFKYVQQIVQSVQIKREQDKDLLLRVKEAADIQVSYINVFILSS